MKELKINPHLSLYLYYFLFAASGFAGLIYESIWTHYLKLFLGHAAYAQTLVLIIFMGGMAVGAWVASRYSFKISNLLLGYAIVEGVIGLLAILFHQVFVQTTEFAYLQVIPNLHSVMAVTLFKWTLASLLILPQCILLGATFPLMSAGIIRHFPAKPGHSLAILYFANSLGAAIGILSSGFVLIAAVGLPGTIFTAGLINLFIAGVMWLLCHNDSPSRAIGSQPREKVTSSPLWIAFLCCAGFTGLSSFLYEIGWIRMLSLVLGSSTHAFELMLSAFILGLALGGYWIRRRIDSLTNLLSTLGWVQILMGLLALSTLLSYGYTFNLMRYMILALTKTDEGYILFNLVSQSIAILIMLPASFCAGMTLPLLTYYLIVKGYGERAIGSIYAANTLGAIVGVSLGVQFIMPELGVKNLITIGSGIDLLLGLALLWYATQPVKKILWSVTATLTTILLVASVLWVSLDPLKMASGVFRNGRLFSADGTQILFHRDGKTASVDLYKTGRYTIISTNGKPDAGLSENEPSKDEPTMVLMAMLPYATHLRATKVANIGIGSGLTSQMLLTIPAIKQVDTIEIEPAMVEGAKGFGERVAKTFTDPRSHIYIEDAKTFFTNHQQIYDLIISEPSNPWVSGVAGLFSEEFYHLIRNHLNDDGLLVQWFHLYEMDSALVASVLKALAAHFEDYAIYFTVEADLIILAKKHGQVNEPSEKIFDIPEVAAQLRRLGLVGQQDFLLRYLGSKRSLAPLFNSYDIPANSDYFPVLDLGAVKSRFLGHNVIDDLQKLRSTAAPLIEILDGKPTRTAPLAPGNNLHFKIGQNALQAKYLFLYFQALLKKQPPPDLPMDPSTVILLQNIRSLHQQYCSGGEAEAKWLALIMEKGWFPYLKYFAETTLPFLSPPEMATIWADLEAAPSINCLPDRLRQWLNLYKAVGNRDFAQVLQVAARLLPQGAISDSPENQYLVMVSILAHLALDQKIAAVTLWRRYVPSEVEPLPIELRWLATTALQRLATTVLSSP